MTGTRTQGALFTGLALGIAASALTTVAVPPAVAQRPDPGGSVATVVPRHLDPSPWIIRFTGEGKIVLRRSLD